MYKNTIFYLLLGIFMIIILSQFGYIKNDKPTILEGLTGLALLNQIKDDTTKIWDDVKRIKGETDVINNEIKEIQSKIATARSDKNKFDQETKDLQEETAALNAQNPPAQPEGQTQTQTQARQ
jgi:peptidoglycan hydrolase CwlO-like protein